MLLRSVRLVPVAERSGSDGAASAEPVDVRLRDGLVAAVGPHLPRETGEEVWHLDGRWLIPGLWDAHVHLGQWARQGTRLEVAGTTDRDAVLALVASACSGSPRALVPAGTEPARPASGAASGALLVGGGYRPAQWPQPPTVAGLDRVSGARPVVLVSGDAHAGWLNTAALRLLGLPDRDDPVVEAEWFAVLPRVLAIEDAQVGAGAYTAALGRAARLGVVGVCDFEFERGFELWRERYPKVGVALRVRTSTYPADLDAAITAGVRTGDALGDPLVTMGSLKIISDGSLNTRTAHCCEPYADGRHGVQNVPAEELTDLLGRARSHGLEVALHAIGDAAVALAVDAFERTGAAGSIEHAQLVGPAEFPRIARLGLVASVQPAHLLDDRAVTAAIWGEGRAARSFPLRSLASAGVALAFGSDAPVSTLDPWRAMAAAVHRGEPSDQPWYSTQSLTTAEALAASTGGRGTVRVGAPADLALLDADPLAPGEPTDVAARLRRTQVAATIVAGRVVHVAD